MFCRRWSQRASQLDAGLIAFAPRRMEARLWKDHRDLGSQSVCSYPQAVWKEIIDQPFSCIHKFLICVLLIPPLPHCCPPCILLSSPHFHDCQHYHWDDFPILYCRCLVNFLAKELLCSTTNTIECIEFSTESLSVNSSGHIRPVADDAVLFQVNLAQLNAEQCVSVLDSGPDDRSDVDALSRSSSVGALAGGEDYDLEDSDEDLDSTPPSSFQDRPSTSQAKPSLWQPVMLCVVHFPSTLLVFLFFSDL